MADLATTLALLTNDDLGAFSRNAAQNNILMQLSPALAGIRFNQSTWSPQTSTIGNFAQAFLSTALGEIGRNQVAEQTRMAASLLPQLYADPMSVQRPEGMDAGPFEMLKGSSALKAMQREQAAAQIRQQLADEMFADAAKNASKGMTSGNPREQAASRAMMEQLAQNPRASRFGIDTMLPSGAAGALPDYDPMTDPDSPEYKVFQDQIANERTIGNDFLKQAELHKYKEQGLKALAEAYLDPAGTSDFELIRRASQAVEPGLAVRADDEASLQGAASLLGMSYNAVKSAVTGETKLSPEVRAGMMRIAKRSYDSTLDDYNILRDTYVNRAKKAGIDPASAVPFGPGRPFEDLFPDLDIALGSAPSDGSLSSGSTQAGTFRSSTGNVITGPDGNVYEIID